MATLHLLLDETKLRYTYLSKKINAFQIHIFYFCNKKQIQRSHFCIILDCNQCSTMDQSTKNNFRGKHDHPKQCLRRYIGTSYSFMQGMAPQIFKIEITLEYEQSTQMTAEKMLLPAKQKI